MRYRLRLDGKEIKSVISVNEVAKNNIAEYAGLDGESFCERVSSPLRHWDIELLADNRNENDGEALIERLREIRDNRKAVRLTVSSAVGDVSARVLLEKLQIRAGYGDCSTVSLELIEYKRAAALQSEAARVGMITNPPESTKAGTAYQLITKYQKAGESLKVANPNTGAEVDNLVTLKPDAILKVEKCADGTKSALLALEEKKNKIIDSAYNIIGRLK